MFGDKKNKKRIHVLSLKMQNRIVSETHRRRGKFFRFLHQKAGRIVLTIGLCLLFWFWFIGGNKGALRLWEMKREEKALRVEVTTLTKENKRIKAEIEALKKNPKLVERKAREELDMVRDGEVIYKIVTPTE